MVDPEPVEGEIQGKNDAALRLTDQFLDAVFAEPEFDSVFDRGTTVAVGVLRYLSREQIDPVGFMGYIQRLIDKSLVVIEPGENQWH